MLISTLEVSTCSIKSLLFILFLGSPTPLWINPSKTFFKVFYLANCVFSLLLILIFVILTIINNGNSSKISASQVDINSGSNIAIIKNYYYELNATTILNNSNATGYPYTTNSMKKADSRVNNTLDCIYILETEEKAGTKTLRILADSSSSNSSLPSNTTSSTDSSNSSLTDKTTTSTSNTTNSAKNTTSTSNSTTQTTSSSTTSTTTSTTTITTTNSTNITIVKPENVTICTQMTACKYINNNFYKFPLYRRKFFVYYRNK